jgi:uncharacterized protein
MNYFPDNSIVADASALIALSRIGRLSVLSRLYERVDVTPTVMVEVLGEKAQARDPAVAHIRAGLREAWIKEVALTGEETTLAAALLNESRLHRGESESIAVARVRGVAVILDDKEARVHAGTVGVEYTGTAGVLYQAFRKGILSYPDLEDAVTALAGVMWLSPLVVAEVLRRAREVAK